ncbi:MAG: VOC family protein [Pseudomonadales bacterium]|nr:VOC family protein [Pseudomonadales bacterium]
MSAPQADFIWYELMTPDSDAAAAFYGAVVGWKIEPPADGAETDYRMIVRDDKGNAGGMLELTQEMIDGGAGPLWIPYLYCSDVDATISAIEKAGGVLQMPPTDLPVGRIAMIADPQGVPIYIMDPIPPDGAPDTGSDVFSPDALQRVGWNELESPDLEESKRFYTDHFGFEFNESMNMGEMGDYCFIDHDSRRLGAVFQQQDRSQSASWQMYFRVPSVTAAKATVESKSGTVLMGPMEVPGGDWIIIATDPQGARFGLVSAGA